MRNWLLDKKLDDLSCRMADVPVSGSTRIDPNCFSESERLLFRRVEEITEKYGKNPPQSVLVDAMPFFLKGVEVLRWRALDLFQTSMETGDPIRDWYFKLHLVNFLARLKETFENLGRWTERDRQDFLEHQDLSKVFIMPSVSGVKAKKLGRRKMG